MRRGMCLFVVALFTSTMVSATGSNARAAAPPEWEALAAEIAHPWPGLIDERGRFPDYVQARDPEYPPPMLGYALLVAGLRDGREDQVNTGLRALNSAVRDINPRDKTGVFHHFALASAYNVARIHLTDHPLFATHRVQWENWLRRINLKHLPVTNHYANKYMVEAVAVLELGRTGLRSRVKGSALGDAPRSAHLARRLVNVVAPRAASHAATRVAGGSAYILSDPSNNALAYHGLTFGFYARAVELLGDDASPAARRALQGVARASWGFQGPDGDLSYIGRSQGMAWTLGLSTYGSEVAAGESPEWAPRFRAVSDRAVHRLATRYGNGPWGLWITPSRDGGAAAANRGLDRYAAGPSYAGLTLIGLNWAIEHAERHDRQVGQLAADADGARTFSSPRTAFATVRARGSWFAVRKSRSFAAHDLRYDMGLVALKRPAADGDWVDVVRPRPHTTRRGDSAGPLLLSGAGGRLIADAEKSSVAADGSVTLRGGYRSRDGHWQRRGVAFRYEPVDCGVRMTIPRRAGDAVAYSVFFTERPSRNGDTLTGGPTAVSATPGFSVRTSAGWASAVDAKLVRAELRFRPGRGPVRITVCGR